MYPKQETSVTSNKSNLISSGSIKIMLSDETEHEFKSWTYTEYSPTKRSSNV